MDPLAALFSSLLPPEIDLRDKADDLRHKIIIKMAATVKTIPPITADKMMISGRLSGIKTRQVYNLSQDLRNKALGF